MDSSTLVAAVLGLCKIAASYAGKRLQILYCFDDHIKRLKVDALPWMNKYISHIEDVELKKMLEASPTDPSPQEDPTLQNFKDLASDIEDILDEVSIRAERYQLSNTSSRRALNFCCEPVCCCFATCCFDYSDSSSSDRRCKFSVAFYTRVALRINDIYIQLEKIAQSKEIQTRLLPDTSASENSSLIAFDDETYENKNRETTELANRGFKMIGREGVKEDILRKLQNAESNLLVIPIIGMGGVGKSTMARSVFDDTAEKKEFQFMKWVFVGKNFDATSLLKEGILGDPQLVGNLGHIYDKVKEKVKGNKFLIVLDDVWSEDQQQWEKLLIPLTHGGDCSRVLVTTRLEGVAKAACNNVAYHVKLGHLDDDSCVALFEQYAFPNGVQDKHKNLRKIGKEIVSKLQGHPLAAKVIGSTLCGETNESEWRKILCSSLWSDDVKDKYNIVMSTLLWSYCRLPHHLKQCFRLCSIFEKGERIPKTMLIEMWIAHGYVSESTRPKDVGSRYMDDLCSASLFQYDHGYDYGFQHGYFGGMDEVYVYLGDDHGLIQMHDLIHDLAQLVSRGEASRIIQTQQEIYNSNPARREYFLELSLAGNTIQIQQQASGTLTDQAKNIRHLAVYVKNSDAFDWDILLKFIDWKRLRTLIVRGDRRSIPKSVSSQLRSVRVLVALLIKEYFDDMIINVVHLRVLSGVATDLRGHVSKLTRLRVLDDSTEIKGIGKLTSLQHLRRYCVQDKDGYRIKELKGLQLHGQLTIKNLENVKGGYIEAKEAVLHEKEHLIDLKLKWSVDGDDEDVVSNHEEVLKGLCPHKNLKRLRVEGFAGRHFGLALDNYSSMVSIHLYKCRNLVELPPLGQMSGLKYLSIQCLDKLRKVTRQFYGSSLGHAAAVVFPSLEVLDIFYMEEWTEWDGLEDKDNNNMKFFPSLQKLEIFDCKKLRGIPHLPSSIKTLELFSVGLTTIPKFWGCKGGIHDQQHQTLLLRKSYITRCPSLKSTGECLLEHPASVECLEINGCGSLTEISASKHFFLVGRMDVEDCKNLKTLNLPGTRNVTHLDIYRCNVLSNISLGNPILSRLAGLDVTCVASETVTDLTADPSDEISSIHVAPDMLRQLSRSDSSGVMEYPLRNVEELKTDIWDVLNFVCPNKLRALKLYGAYTRKSPRRLRDFTLNAVYSYEEKQWWERLTSLKTLQLITVDDLLGSAWFWENLQRIPFLKRLELLDCGEIKTLPEKDLPLSLRFLKIYRCPHLEERYKEGGERRDILLAHIPQLEIYIRNESAKMYAMSSFPELLGVWSYFGISSLFIFACKIVHLFLPRETNFIHLLHQRIIACMVKTESLKHNT